MKVCVIEGTTHEEILESILSGSVIIRASSLEDMIDAFANQICHVVASEAANIPFARIRATGYKGAFIHGQGSHSREPLCLVTRVADKEWSRLVNLIVNIFYLAEAHNITQDSADEIISLFLEGNSVEGMEIAITMASIISQFGNYGEIYDRYVQHDLPRSGLNMLYDSAADRTKQTGLLYSFPMSSAGVRAPDPIPGSALDTIISRGYLRCALSSGPSEFAQAKSGFDMAFCQAVAAALFGGNAEAVNYTAVAGIQQLSLLLADDAVDVAAGARVTLLAEYEGFRFSPAYFYGDGNMDVFSLMTSGNDSQLSDFVYWVVMALIFAEEQGIDQDSANEISVTNLFGESLKQCLRDCISAMGSCATM